MFYFYLQNRGLSPELLNPCFSFFFLFLFLLQNPLRHRLHHHPNHCNNDHQTCKLVNAVDLVYPSDLLLTPNSSPFEMPPMIKISLVMLSITNACFTKQVVILPPTQSSQINGQRRGKHSHTQLRRGHLYQHWPSKLCRPVHGRLEHKKALRTCLQI